MIPKTLLLSAGLGLTALLVPAVDFDATAAGSAGKASRAYLHSYNLPGHGVAIEGYSPVSYFEGEAERGSALFAVEHDGVTYHLTGAAQVAKFRAEPGKYVPAFGGWCAFGMSVEDKFPVDPTCFSIVDGRLYLFLRNGGIDARELWRKGDEARLLQKAHAHWKSVQG